MTIASEATAASAAETGAHIGDRMKDGAIYAGISPDTGKAFYALPADAPLTMQWQQAMDYAARFEGNGHPAATFRLPTGPELKVMFNNRASIGGFNESYSASAWYWSSTTQRVGPGKVVRRFVDGSHGWFLSSTESSLRLVRD